MNNRLPSARNPRRAQAVKCIVSLLLAMTSPLVVRAADPTLTIDVGQTVGKASPILYGLMTAEISHSYDGGLYAELVRNRSFLDNEREPAHWSVVQGNGAGVTIALDRSAPL